MRAVFVVILTSLVSGCASTRVAREQIESPGHALFNGYANPKADCHRCHGGNGQGSLTGPNLKVVRKYSVEDIVDAIDEGPKQMPSYRESLSVEEKRQLAEWLKAKFPPDA